MTMMLSAVQRAGHRASTHFVYPLYRSTTIFSRPRVLFSSKDTNPDAKDTDSSAVDPSSSSSSATPPSPNADAPAAQHEEWVKFQQSIAVDGFETGQATTIQTGRNKNNRGRAQKRKLNEAQAKIIERQRLTAAGGGEYPPMRYSEEETQRLLAQAYAAIPPRAGKRGTRNKKRQERRWALVREIRAKYKAHMANFQERKMQERSRKMKEIKAMLTAAPAMRQNDREYQFTVYERWAATMQVGPHATKLLGSSSSDTAAASGPETA